MTDLKRHTAEVRAVASCRAHEEESPGNTEHRTSEMKAGGNVGHNVEENNRRATSIAVVAVRVRRWCKRPPAPEATPEAAHAAGCKTKYTGNQGLLVHCRGVGCL